MENDGIPLCSFSSSSCFFVSVTNPDDRVGKRTGDRRCIARNNGARGTTTGGGPNGQSDERCAIIASAKIGSRQDAAGGNITFRGGAQKP